MFHLKRWLLLATICAVVATAIVPAAVGGQQEQSPVVSATQPVAPWQARGCSHSHSRKAAARGIRTVMHSRLRVTKQRGRRVHHFAGCVRTKRTQRVLRKLVRDLKSYRRSYRGYWRIQAKRTKHDEPGRFRFVLNVLRPCEGTTYDRVPGHPHFGAYQYDVGTWAAAQIAFGSPVRYRVYGRASNASKDHQDAVTTRYFPGPNNNWVASVHCWGGHKTY